MRILRLHRKLEYWEQIRSGIKTEEYRLETPYWHKRLQKEYDEVHLLLGYPKPSDTGRILIRKWRGYTLKTISHDHFGSSPVDVFAIDLGTGAAV